MNLVMLQAEQAVESSAINTRQSSQIQAIADVVLIQILMSQSLLS
jgi:hypothetical protein